MLTKLIYNHSELFHFLIDVEGRQVDFFGLVLVLALGAFFLVVFFFLVVELNFDVFDWLVSRQAKADFDEFL